MSYFSKFPLTKFTFDDVATVQVVTNIATRAKLSDEISNNLSLFYPFIIKDGETPEILADKFYNDPQLHWLILHCNEIHDARFGWPMSVPNLVNYTNEKYGNRFAIHHYEDTNDVVINGNVYVNSANAFAEFYVGNVIINNTSDGKGYITSKINSSNIVISISTGGFQSGDNIKCFSNANVTANITNTTPINCIPVTNYVHEDRLNESRRNIKILKTQYIEPVIREFETKISS